MNLVALAWFSMRFESLTASCLRSGLGVFLCWRRCTPHSRTCWMVGAIHPSQSPWCNAVVLVRKKYGMLCFRIDFCRLNACTNKDSYPLLWIQEVLESMAGAAHFSIMDFKSGFWQVKMVPESQQYTAFTIGNLGLYEFTCMPFGLCNAPVTFQCLMQNTLG